MNKAGELLTVGEYRKRGFVGTAVYRFSKGCNMHARIPFVAGFSGHGGLDRFRPPRGVISWALYFI